MKLREWIDFIDDHVSEYLEILFGTLTKPALLLHPIWKQSESGLGDGKFIFNPRLFIFSTLSILLGLVIQSFIPNHRVSEDYVRAVTLITLLWILFSCVGYFILFPKQSQWNFLDSVSLIFQVLSVQYVIASMAALVWGILYLGLRSLGIPENPSPVYEYLGSSPIFVYFFVQFLFLSIYLPYAVVTVWRLTRTAFILRTFSTVMLAFLWSTFSFFALQVTEAGPITPIIPTPAETATPTPAPTPTLPPIDEEKLNILLAALDGPEDTYGVRDQMLDELNADFSGDEGVQIIPVDTVILASQGSEAARELGSRYRVDLVIWGWYRETEHPNITIHIENLSPEQLIPLETSRTLQSGATLAELESFRFQHMTAQEMSAFLSFLAGFIDFRAENYTGAITYFNESLDDLAGAMIFENQAEIHFYRGSARYLLGMVDRAIEDFNESIALGAERFSVYNNRGNAYVELEEYGLARQDYERAIELDPDNADPYNGRGNAYVGLAEYELAVHDYDQAIALEPDYAFAYNGRGNSYRELGEAERAVQDYDHAIELDPNYTLPYNGRGNAYFDLQQYDLAIEDYTKAIALDPGYASAYNGRGNAYRELGEVDLALQNYSKAIELDPAFFIAFRNRGMVLKDLGDCSRAIEDFNQALKLEPSYVNAYNDRGSCYLDLHRYNEALDDYNSALALDPAYMLAYYNLGNVYFDLKEYERAIQLYIQAIELDSEYKDAYHNLANAYGYLGEFENGIAAISRLIEMKPEDADAYLTRGNLYQAMGRKAEAQADFERYEQLTGQAP